MREGNWIWQSSGDDIDYSRFQPGEPNGGYNENCLLMQYENGNWVDTSCLAQVNFQICERTAPKPTAVVNTSKISKPITTLSNRPEPQFPPIENKRDAVGFFSFSVRNYL